MGTFLVILIVIFALWPIILRWLRPLIMRYMQRKAEDYIRKAAGFPPREEQRKRRASSKSSGNAHRTQSGYQRQTDDGPVIPREYAEDVEFVEYKQYSSDTTIKSDGHRVEIKEESQVSDVEWEEIK